MTKRVTICGAFGGVNIGDEAIAQTMKAQCERAFPDAQIGLLCFVSQEELDRTGYALEGAQITSRQGWRTFASWLRQGPLVIGGGQMLNGQRIAKGPLFLLAAAILARMGGQDVYILGMGTRAIDKFHLSRFAVRRLCRAAKLIRVRDLQSKNAMISCGVPPGRIEVTADVVFSGVITDSVTDKPKRTTGHYCLAVHQSPLVTHYDPAAYADFVMRLATQPKARQIDLICHDKRPGYDLEFAKAVTAALPSETPCPINIVAPDTVEETMALYTRAEMVLSSRMHPLIMGLCADAKVVPLKGSPKVADLATRYGITTLPDVNTKGPALKLALMSPEKGGAVISGVPDDLRADAQRNFTGIGAQ